MLMQNGPDYPSAEIAFLHPTLDFAILNIVNPGCTIPLYPSDQRLVGEAWPSLLGVRAEPQR